MFIYLLLINILAFCTTSLDKLFAIKRKWRIPEKVMILISLLGGAMGNLLAFISFRHKIRKHRLFYTIILLTFLQLIILFKG